MSEEATAEKEAESASSVERIEEIEGKKTELRATLSNLQLSQMKDIEEIRAKAKKVIHTLRSRFEDNLEDLNERYREKIVRLESNLQLRRKVETHEIEERKNKHINELIANHERAFKEMKDYYNDITRYNLKAIKQHKEELVQLREKNEKNHGHLVEFRDKNRDLEAPLRKALVEVEQLRHRLKNRAKDQLSLEYATARLQLVKGKVAKLRSEKDALEERFRRVEAERDQIYEGFEGTVQRIERQGELRNVVMERQIDLKDKQLQERTVALQTVVREARQHPEMLKIRPDEKGGIRKVRVASYYHILPAYAYFTTSHLFFRLSPSSLSLPPRAGGAGGAPCGSLRRRAGDCTCAARALASRHGALRWGWPDGECRRWLDPEGP